MRMQIEHRSLYRYTHPIVLEPHLLRFRPREDAHQRLMAYTLAVDPVPAGRTEVLELEGNTACSVWFHGATDHLHIVAEMEVETLRTNPFDFLVTDPTFLRLPVTWPAPDRFRLSPYLLRAHPTEPIDRWAAVIAADAGGSPLGFITALNGSIQSTCRMIVREQAEVLPPPVTLAGREGCCRDLAMLFIDACRSMNVPARFVSGYELGGDREMPRALHAWAEVYLPGAGWRGFDPSQGLAVGQGHVAIAAGPSPSEVAPVLGSFRGSATAAMHTEIRVRALP